MNPELLQVGEKYWIARKGKSKILCVYNGQDMGKCFCFVPVQGLGFYRVPESRINDVVSQYNG